MALTAPGAQRRDGGKFAGVRVYCAESPQPHWHFVTFGLTDLGDKDSPDPDHSGYGFELTCRVPLTQKVVQLADAFIDQFEGSLVAPAVLEWSTLPNLKLRVLPAKPD